MTDDEGRALRATRISAPHHPLADMLTACAPKPGRAADMLPVLFQHTLDLHQTTFAMGEVVTHLHAPGSDGVLRLQRVA